MAKTFKNWSEIEKYLKAQINSALENEVAKQVRDEMVSAISDVVYDAGTPTQYIRRGGNDYGGMGNADGTGSLADRNEMQHTVKNGELTVTNEAERNKGFNEYAGYGYDTSKSLSENIIKGYGNRDTWYNQPRDFIEETKNNLKSSKSHVEAMREGLTKRGLKVID